jgi:hypothetical protein
MNLYKLTQEINTGYDTYDSCIVAAENEEKAVLITPDGRWEKDYMISWCKSPDQVKCELIGMAVIGTKEGIILSSFNAG